MADAREMTMGLQFDFGSAVAALGNIVDQIEEIKAGFTVAEEGAQNFGSAAANAGTACKKSADSVREGFTGIAKEAEEAAGDVKQSFQGMGTEVKTFGDDCRDAMGTAAKETDSFAKKFKAGFQNTFSQTSKQLGKFGAGIKQAFKAVGTAIRHPIQNIKKMAGAFGDAGDKLKDVGTAAKKAEKDLEGAGKAGSEAGTQIKDAFKGAISAIIGIEAIKAGIEAIKNFVGASLEAAGAVESIGKKFDAVFGPDAKDVEVWADSFSSSVHRSETEVKGFLTSSAARFKNLGLSAQDAIDFSKITTSLGYDIGAKFSIDDSEAMAAVQEAISGNGEALSEFGIQLDEVTLKQKALTMGFGEELSELDDTSLALIRFNSILDQSRNIQQGAITDNNGLVNSTKGLKTIYNDFMSDAGAKFTPVVEQLFSSISQAWPTVEPMLMGFVSVLADGFQEAVPILMDLGTTLIPILTSTLGTLFGAINPLLPVFGELAKTILPPLVGILGALGETLIPPIADVLSTLNNAILKPILPILQKIIEAFLPPLVPLLEAISPLLEAISPLIKIIGDVIGIIAEGLGKVIGWLAGGVNKIAGFFGGLFGGARESEKEIGQLGTAMDDIGAKTIAPTIDIPGIPKPEIPSPDVPVIGAVSPEIERPAPLEPVMQPVQMEFPAAVQPSILEPAVMPIAPQTNYQVPPVTQAIEIESGEYPAISPAPITVPMTVQQPEMQIPGMKPVQLEVEPPIMPEIEPPKVEPIPLEYERPEAPKIGAADTAGYTKSVFTANAGIRKDMEQTWIQAHDTAKSSLQTIGTEAENAHNAIAGNAESMWNRIVSAAQAGARTVAGCFRLIGETAAGISDIDIRVSGGAELPHNAKGTDNFQGGWTHINEEGGEVAFLPKGTAILPEDKSAQLVQTVSQNNSNSTKNSTQVNVNVPPVTVNVMGNVDESILEQIKQQLGPWIRDMNQKAIEDILESNSAELTNQHAFA